MLMPVGQQAKSSGLAFLVLTVLFSPFISHGWNPPVDANQKELESQEVQNRVFANLNHSNFLGFQEGSVFEETTVSTGSEHSCAINASGWVHCWGRNNWGEIGDGTYNIGGSTTYSRGYPTATLPMPENRSAQSVAVGGGFSCALLDNGKIACWGLSLWAGVGISSQQKVATPTLIDYNFTTRTAVAIDAGSDHACAIMSDGGMLCWGSNAYGQLGDGTNGGTASSPINVTNLTSLGTPVAVSAGASRTCMVTNQGSVVCWGANSHGQLGNGNMSDTYAPHPDSVVDLSLPAAAVSTGWAQTCALLVDGTINCWGRNSWGSLGDGTTITSSTPVNVTGIPSGRTAISISSGTSHACATLDNRSVICWGDNSAGKLGDGTIVSRTTATVMNQTGSWGSVISQYGFSSISAGPAHTCGTVSAVWPSSVHSYLFCWGSNNYGRLGGGGSSSGFKTYPSHVSTSDGFAISERDIDGGGVLNIFQPHKVTVKPPIATGSKHSCVLSNTTTVYCWGDASYKQLNGNNTQDQTTPVLGVQFQGNVSYLEAAGAATCAVFVNGSAECWGTQQSTTGYRYPFATLPNPIAKISMSPVPTQMVTAGPSGAYAIDAVGDLYLLGGTPYNPTQVQFPSGRTVEDISVGPNHRCALLDNNSLMCWGQNNNGQLGDGTTSNSNTPVYVGSMPNGVGIQKVGVGLRHSCALLEDGGIACWGTNLNSALGNSSNSYQSQNFATNPTMTSPLPDGSKAIDLAVGRLHTCATLDNGEVACWGYPIGYTSPTVIPLPNSRSAVSVSAGEYHVCAVLDNASVMCLGQNADAQLGNGGSTNSLTSWVYAQMPVAASIMNLDTDLDGFISDDSPSDTYSSRICPAGMYGRYTCEATPAGTYTGVGDWFPTYCERGTYQSVEGQSTCIDSDIGYFVNHQLATNQTSCPLGHTTNSTKSTSIADCFIPDIDGDGVGDYWDNFPNDPNDWNDSDSDGYGDNTDAFPDDANEWNDSDLDGYGDNSDIFPEDAGEWNDSDSDGYGDNTDAFPLDENEWNDSDSDGFGDNADIFPDDENEWNDSDLDGYGDNGDAFPDDPNEWNDSDLDGYGDNSDAFPENGTEWKDSDGDGYGDNNDLFPEDHGEWNDSDSDGYGDNSDAFPNDTTEWNDSDSDGYGDNADAFPLNASEWNDLDADGYGDNTDLFPSDSNEWNDSDLDGVGDNADMFPFDTSEHMDSDGDGVGDNSDVFPNDRNETKDSDDDGVGNNADAFPFDPGEVADSDSDGVGDNTDVFPNNANESVDTDGDGVGDNADAFPDDETESTDQDGDGIGDNSDMFPYHADEHTDSDGDGVGDNADAYPFDPSKSVESTNAQTYALALMSLVVLVGVIALMRRRGPQSKPVVEIESDSEGNSDQGPTPIQADNSHQVLHESAPPESQIQPSIGSVGVIGDDGYEWIEYPEDSGNHYYRVPGRSAWESWEN